MKKYYLIDGTNNNKVINEFSSEEEAMDYVNAKEFTENWGNNWETFQDYKDEFFIVDSDEMEEAVRKYGSRKRFYWT